MTTISSIIRIVPLFIMAGVMIMIFPQIINVLNIYQQGNVVNISISTPTPTPIPTRIPEYKSSEIIRSSDTHIDYGISTIIGLIFLFVLIFVTVIYTYIKWRDRKCQKIYGMKQTGKRKKL
jgi:hypothetical protein